MTSSAARALAPNAFDAQGEALAVGVIVALSGAYSALMLAFGQFDWIQWGSVGAVLALCFAARATRRLAIDFFPGVFIGWGYDALRVVKPFFVTPERIVSCGWRNLELKFFAVAPNQTFSDYFAVHHAPLADLFFAVPYFIFIYVVVLYSLFLFWRDRPRMRRYLWALAIAYGVTFAAWLIMPTAPPWYIEAHGCAVSLADPSSAAGLARVDKLLGVGYFASFYARNPDIFGAFPSMHCAFPTLGLLTAWRATKPKWRAAHLVYVVWMFAASVYLGHHGVLDALSGLAVAALAVGATALLPWTRRKQIDAAFAHLAAAPLPALDASKV